jgi:hypothetical protein
MGSGEKMVSSGVQSSVYLDLEKPITRPLKAYAFDPSRGRVLGNEMTLNVRYQDLDFGPVVRDRAPDAIAIVDYDGANKTWYKPVNLDDPRILIRGGLDPSESDPRFHQQMAYAVVTETIQHFEAALGRRIHWRRQEREKDSPPGALPGDIYTLNIYPHAMVSANAFYSPKAHGILFGYFRADEKDPGRNLPGQTVFTCLSHDVVVHETTHAIIDGIRTYFTEYTNPDVPAFHEAFADVVALFRHFSHKEVLLDAIQRTGGAIYRYQLRPEAAMSPADRYAAETSGAGPGNAAGELTPAITAEIGERNPLIELAQQFGEATGRHTALRSALGTRPNSDDIRRFTEPHQRGSILVAAIFDAFFSIYLRRTADLFRIYRSGGGRLEASDLPEPLADRLAAEASRTANKFFQVCVRALDYCPPVDITYGDFLRALITTERDLHPVDEIGVRDSFIQAFRLRGIIPESATFFSEGAISWPTAEPLGLTAVKGLDFGDPNGLTWKQKRLNAGVLKAYANDRQNKEKLGFDPKLDVSVPSYHPVFRINPDGTLRTDMIVEMVQKREAKFTNLADAFGRFPMRGGATVIISKPTLDQLEDSSDAPVRFVIAKHLHGGQGELRESRQRQYLQRLGLMEGTDAERFQINFEMVHEGL